MADEKRIIQGYEEMHCIRLGGKEFIIAENKDEEARYMVCDCTWNNPLGIDFFDNAIGSADYLEIMKEFTNRLSEQVIILETERETRGIPLEVVKDGDCHSIRDVDLEGQCIVIKAEKFSPEFRSIDHQLALCTGGNGANPDARGQTVFCQNLITGKTEAWRRFDIAGLMPPDRLPDWARVNLEALQEDAGKKTVEEPPKPLDKEQFWQIIDEAREKAGRWQDMYEPLFEALSRLDEPDIIQWRLIFDEYYALSRKNGLWAAADIMLRGCSDGSFDYFRGWLIAQGKDVFLGALAEPDSLVDLKTVKALGYEVLSSEYTPMDGYEENARFERIIYAAGNAYENKYGTEVDFYKILVRNHLTEQERADIAGEIVYSKIIDEKWGGKGVPLDEIDTNLERLCPKLYVLFNEPDVPEVSAEKESVLEKIKQSQQKPEPKKPKPEKKIKTKTEPEL